MTQRDFFDFLMAMKNVPQQITKDDIPLTEHHRSLNESNRDIFTRFVIALETEEAEGGGEGQGEEGGGTGGGRGVGGAQGDEDRVQASLYNVAS